MQTKHRKEYTRGGYKFVECELCGKRYNVGRPGNVAGIRYCQALKNDWWAKHTGQKSTEAISVPKSEASLCEKVKIRGNNAK